MSGAPANTSVGPHQRFGARDRHMEVVHLSKSYDGAQAVDDVSFSLGDGQFLSLLGPSGSGKTSTLLMVAGFEQPTSGDIRVAGRSILEDPPQRRNLGVGFQSYALFPHMSVLQNVEFPLRMRRVARRERRARASDLLEKVGLTGLEDRRPRQLSGGQQQRVSLARALVFEPDALLLDEPLGALDKRLREHLQLEIKELHLRTGVSVLYVTHDQEEAMAMSDRIAVMCEGRVVQLGTPEDVYHHPQTAFVAHFLGETNLLPCRQRSSDGTYAQVIYTNGVRGLAKSQRPYDEGKPSEVKLSVRPERIEFLTSDESRENETEAVVVSQTFLGSHTRFVLEGLAQQLIVKSSSRDAMPHAEPGETRRVGWAADDVQILSCDE